MKEQTLLLTTLLLFVNQAISQVALNEIAIGNFELIEVRGIDRNISNKINHQILLHSILNDELDFGLDTYGILNQIEKRYKENGNGIISIESKVNYNQSNILSLTVTTEYLGAYISISASHLNFSTLTGEILHLNDIVNKSGFKYIDERIRKEVGQRIEKVISDSSISSISKEEKKNLFEDYKTLFSYPSNFIYTDSGIELFVNYGFPHVAKALEPENIFKFDFSELLGYFIQDKSYDNPSNSSSYAVVNNERSKIYQDPTAFEDLNLKSGKTICKVCLDDIGRVVYAEILDSKSDKGIVPNNQLKKYLKAIYNYRFEPNLNAQKEECLNVTNYHYKYD